MTKVEYKCVNDECSFTMVRDKYHKTYSEGQVVSYRESKYAVCCGKKMFRREL